ncbi:GlxA family transcriptional regulator [Streptomyces sp. NPDC047108]|uniref:GlxA family transcriptional regulator n=1 Tax=Streptomyces sp. NPDC047108 TaxID=3155025 RepID=UPI0033F8A2FF
MSERTVLIVLFEGVQSLDVTGPLEVFTGAATALSSADPGDPAVLDANAAVRGAEVSRAAVPGGGDRAAYRVLTATLDGAPVRSSSGLLLTPDCALPDAPAAHTLLVPGGYGTRAIDPHLTDRVREAAAYAQRVVSVCSGAYVLAEAGLLDGRRATTHWSRCADLARRFPAVEVVPDAIYVRDGSTATSAGVTAGIDLALALVEEDVGRDIALLIARYLVVFLRRPGNQTQFSVQLATQTARREPLRDVQQWIAEHPGDDLSVEALARRARLSPRHFARAFQAEVGCPPGRYVDRVRLEAARRLLEDTSDGVEEISRACGYGTPESMRRAFLRALGTGPAEYRCRFRPLEMSAAGGPTA